VGQGCEVLGAAEPAETTGAILELVVALAIPEHDEVEPLEAGVPPADDDLDKGKA